MDLILTTVTLVPAATSWIGVGFPNLVSAHGVPPESRRYPFAGRFAYPSGTRPVLSRRVDNVQGGWVHHLTTKKRCLFFSDSCNEVVSLGRRRGRIVSNLAGFKNRRNDLSQLSAGQAP